MQQVWVSWEQLTKARASELHLVWYNGDVGIGIYQELHDMILQYANPHALHAWILVVRGPWLVGPHMSVPRETTYVRRGDSYLDSLLETRIITVHHTFLHTILWRGCSDTTMPRCCTLFDEYTCKVNEALLPLALAHWRHRPAFGHHQTGVLKPMQCKTRTLANFSPPVSIPFGR